MHDSMNGTMCLVVIKSIFIAVAPTNYYIPVKHKTFTLYFNAKSIRNPVLLYPHSTDTLYVTYPSIACGAYRLQIGWKDLLNSRVLINVTD